MAQDTDVYHGLPMMGTVQSPGRYSSTDNGHPKQSQQHFPPCTTQASPPAMSDSQSRALSGCRTPPIPLSPQRLDTSAPTDLARSPQIPALEPDAPQHGGGASAAQEELILTDHALKQEYYSEDLQHRIKDMWPSRPGGLEGGNGEHSMLQRRVSDATARPSSSQPAHFSQGDNGYESVASQSRGWMSNTDNMFQQPFSWPSLPLSTQSPLNQSICYPDRLDLLVDESHPNNNSAFYDTGMGNFRRSFDEVDANYLSFVPATSSFPVYTASAENVPITSLSPSASLSFYETSPAMCQDREDTVPISEGDIDTEPYKDGGWWAEELLGGSPASAEAAGSKVDEPYAQLIYRAFMSRPNRSMTLQEIYAWFRENTDKAKAEGKGWQNSIRHNLSMNGAFTKRNSKTPLNSNADGTVSLDNTGVDGRKSTEWYLEPSFYAGVESTTRYRKGNSGSRSRAANGHIGRSRLGSDGHPGGGSSRTRSEAGRKGGNVAAQNRKLKLAVSERQQYARHMEMARGHPRLHMPGYNNNNNNNNNGGSHKGPMSSYPAAFEGNETYNNYHPTYNPPGLLHHAAPPPPPFTPMPAFGGVPASASARHATELIGYNFFGSDDVGRDVHVKRSRTLATDNEHSEPATPPGSSMDPPRAADDLFGSNKHCGFLPDMGGSYNPLNSYQHSLEDMGSNRGGVHGQSQQQSYTLADVAGIYDPPAGNQQPPVFLEQDLRENALLMGLDLME
ncbi:unnamed protein product [Discula destructiva]